MWGCLEGFTFLLNIFILYPLLALVPAILFLGYYFLRRSAAASAGLSGHVRPSLFAGLFWVVYSLYESWMSPRTVGHPIRLDLIIVWPAQLLFTLFALWRIFQIEREASGGAPASRASPAEALDLKIARRWAFAIVGLSALDILSLFVMRGASDPGRWAPAVITVGLAVLLARGVSWARWLLLLRCAFRVVFTLPAGISMFMTDRTDLRVAGIWFFVTGLLYGAVGLGLILSTRRSGYPPIPVSIRGK